MRLQLVAIEIGRTLMETKWVNSTASDASRAEPTSLVSPAWRIATLGDRLARRTAVVLWLAVAIGLALFAGWSWLVAAGLSTIVLALLPYAAMCALGLCGGSSGKAYSDKRVPGAPPKPNP